MNKFYQITYKVLLFSMILLYSSCQKNGFTVKGDFTHNKYNFCVLDEILPTEIIPTDTILLLNNSFSHTINRTEKGFYRIRFEDTVYITFIAGEKDNISIKGNLDNIKNTQEITGNEESKLFLEVNKKIHEMYLITDSLSKIFLDQKDHEDFARISEELNASYFYYFNLYKEYLHDFIIQHPNKLASISAFYQKIGHRSFFSSEEDRELLEKMIKELSISYPNNQHVIALKEKLENEPQR